MGMLTDVGEYQDFAARLARKPVGRRVAHGELATYPLVAFQDESGEVLEEMGRDANFYVLRGLAGSCKTNGHACGKLDEAVYEICESVIRQHTTEFRSVKVR